MATKTGSMNDMMRARRKEMADLPAYEAPADEAPSNDDADAPTEGIIVAAPGEPSTGERFEYEPFLDTPGAWVVYPPGVPCDDTEYRVQMGKPAAEADFPKMQKAIEDAGGGNPEPSVVSELDSEEDGY